MLRIAYPACPQSCSSRFHLFSEDFCHPSVIAVQVLRSSADAIAWVCGIWHKKPHLTANGTRYYHACKLSLGYVAVRTVTANTVFSAVRDSSYHNVCDLYHILCAIIYNLSVRISNSSCLFSQQSCDLSSFALPIYILSDMKKVKVKAKGRLWVLQHCCLEAYCTLTRMSSFIHVQRRCIHQAAWETSASEGRNYTWNLASNP